MLDNPLLTESDAAGLLGFSVRTLQAWRYRGEGPPYIKLGSGRFARVRYPGEALDAWLKEHAHQADLAPGDG